jgi:hypothetical protein
MASTLATAVGLGLYYRYGRSVKKHFKRNAPLYSSFFSRSMAPMTPPKTPRKRVRESRVGAQSSARKRLKFTPKNPMFARVRNKMKSKRNLFRKKRFARKTSYSAYTKNKGYIKGNKMRAVEQYQKNGVAYVNEYYGTITSPDCFYLMEATVAPALHISYVIMALLRKLFEKHGIRITGVDDVISYNDLGGVTQTATTPTFDVYLWQRSSSGTTATAKVSLNTTFSSVLNTTSTLATVAAAFVQPFRDYSSGYDNAAAGTGTIANLTEPYAFSLVASNGFGVSITPTECVLLFDECNIEGMAVSEIRFQNRTISEDGNTSALDVTNQPLKAREYYFKGLPRPKGANSQQMFRQFPANYGVKVITAGNTGDVAMNTLPAKGLFSNCKASKDFIVNPGEAQKRSLYHHTKKMNVLTFLKKLRVQYGVNIVANTNVSYETNYTIFPTMLLAFEDFIKVAGGTDPTIAWEVYRKAGMVVTEKKKSFCKIDYLQGTVTQTA